MPKYLQDGKGWRFGYFPEADFFVGLVGAENWSIELNKSEFQDFCRLALELSATMMAMQAELSDEENLSCSAQTNEIYMEAAGFPDDFAMHLRLLNGRQAEGIWKIGENTDFLQAIKQIYTNL